MCIDIKTLLFRESVWEAIIRFNLKHPETINIEEK